MILTIEGLTIRIPLASGRRVHAATDVSLALAPGEIHAVIGESGCGKSTVAQAMTGLLPRSAEVSGRVNYDGESLFGREPALLGRHIALIPQSAATFLTPVRTVGDQLEETLRVLDGPHSAEELMEIVDLDPQALALYPHEISGGMAQRAAVAFALAGDPQVIIADEPTASLDPVRTVGLLRLLRRISDRGAAVMLITHDISALIATGVADRLTVVYASRVVEQGSADHLLNGGATDRYTRDLLAALPRNGLQRMPGAPPELSDLPDDYRYATRVAAEGETP